MVRKCLMLSLFSKFSPIFSANIRARGAVYGCTMYVVAWKFYSRAIGSNVYKNEPGLWLTACHQWRPQLTAYTYVHLP